MSNLSEVIHRAIVKVNEEIKRIEMDDAVAIVLNVGHDPDTDDQLRKLQGMGIIEMYVDGDEDDIPDIIVFSGDKIGMDSGLEFLHETTTVIVEENDSGALRRRNTSAIHQHAGKFKDFVYLENEGYPQVIVYSNYSEVITEVGKPPAKRRLFTNESVAIERFVEPPSSVDYTYVDRRISESGTISFAPTEIERRLKDEAPVSWDEEEDVDA